MVHSAVEVAVNFTKERFDIMKVLCIWEHNGGDSIIYSRDFIGAYARGASKEEALIKIPAEMRSYLSWAGKPVPDCLEAEIVQEKPSELNVCDADSDVIFDSEREPLGASEYAELKALAMKSARDFLALYNAIPDKNKSALPARKTFYGDIPRTAFEMYEHTKNVNDYYFGEIDVPADNAGDIVQCRQNGFELLEGQPDFLNKEVIVGSYDEEWSLRKVLRRFIWHDRIHAKAMYRMAIKTFGEGAVPDVFRFGI